MSWEVTETFFETQEIKLDVFTMQALQNLEHTLCDIIKQTIICRGLFNSQFAMLNSQFRNT